VSTSWLLVVDNLEHEVLRELEPVLPPGLTGHILVTSRRRLQGAARIGLLPLSSAIAAAFLLQRTGQDDASAARCIADAVGGLPLALEQAAAYIGVSGRSLASYAGLLEHRLAELLDEGRPQGYPFTVATTWELSFRGLEEERPAAADLLRLCAHLAADDIPLAIIRSAAGQLPAPLGPALEDEIESDRIVVALSGYSLLERQGDAARVHRIVQLVMRESLGAEQRQRWLDVAIGLLRTLFPADVADSERWPLSARLVPHVQAAVDLTPRRRESAELLQLMDRAAQYLQARAQYAEARSLFERVLACRERTFGSDHLDSVESKMNLAIVLRDQGRLSEAGHRLVQALSASERVAGADHPMTATILIHLASVRLAEGDLAGARPLFERVIAASERAVVSHTPETTAHTRAMLVQIEAALPAARPNLSLLFQDPGELAAVRLLFERAVALAEQLVGPDHPVTAVSLNNLAQLVQAGGDLTAARPPLERALAIREHALGTDHPDTVQSLNSLGLLLRAQRDLAQARSVLERALATNERVMGPEHPDTAQNLNNLAGVLREQGDPGAARRLLERALTIREHVLGGDHPATAASLNNLARLLQSQGELDDARHLLTRALAIRERVLGTDHIDSAASMHNLALLLVAAGEPAPARQLFERALATRVAVLGADHPATVGTRAALDELRDDVINP
jgi:tetratricopeptide (TPR) repeat protein